jgi:hypothetical protein
LLIKKVIRSFSLMLFKLKIESLKNNIPHTTSSGEVGEGFDRQAVDRTLDRKIDSRSDKAINSTIPEGK